MFSILTDNRIAYNIKFNCIHVYLMTQKVSIKNKAYFQEKNKTKRTPDYSEVRVVKFGGDERNRTADPLLARQVLSQLSYAPRFKVLLVGPVGFEPTTSRL